MIEATDLNPIRFLGKADLAFNVILDRNQMSAGQVIKNKTTIFDINKHIFCNSSHAKSIYTPLISYFVITALINTPFCLRLYYYELPVFT